MFKDIFGTNMDGLLGNYYKGVLATAYNVALAPKGKVMVPTPEPQPEVECDVYYKRKDSTLAQIAVKAYSIHQAMKLVAKEMKEEINSPVFALIKGGKKDVA